MTLLIGPIDFGTKTSKCGFWSALDDVVGDVLGVDVLHAARLLEAGRELGVDDAGHDARDLDRRLAHLGADRLADADDEVLRAAVGRAAREARLAGGGGDVHEVAAVARRGSAGG